jgi:hypothetical protein
MTHTVSIDHVLQRLGRQVRNLELIWRDGRIVLLGTAHTFYSKQVAQHLVLKLLHPVTLENEIQVMPPSLPNEIGGCDELLRRH